MWKAMILMFVAFSSPPPGHEFIPPPGMIFGDMHQVFVTEAECNVFIDSKRETIKAGMAKATRAANGMEIVTHELTCIVDKNGQPT